MLHRRHHRRGVQNLGAKRREVGDIGKTHPADRLRIRHQPRIGGVHAIDILPDLDLFGVDCDADQRGRVVTAVATEGRDVAVGVRAQEPGQHRHAGHRLQVLQHPPVIRQRSRAAERTVGAHAGIKRIHRGCGHTTCGQRSRDDAGAQPFAVADDGIDDLRGGFADQSHPAGQVAQFVEQRIEQVPIEFQASQDVAVANGDHFGVGRTSRRSAGDGKQGIRNASMRGNDDHGIAVQLTAHHLHGLANGCCTSHRGASELHDDHHRIMPGQVASEKGDRVLPGGTARRLCSWMMFADGPRRVLLVAMLAGGTR